MHGPWDPGWSRTQGRWARGRGPGDPWADMWNEWWRGPAPRAERGTVRWLVLDAIATQPRHGYEIIQAIGDKSNGGYKPSPGVVYPTLQMLEELGHARTIPRDERKVYEITDEGRRELVAHQEEIAEFYEGQADAGWESHAEDFVARRQASEARRAPLQAVRCSAGAWRPARCARLERSSTKRCRSSRSS